MGGAALSAKFEPLCRKLCRANIPWHANQKELNLKMIRDDGEVVGKFTIPSKTRSKA